jgi:hypothetical protein
MDVEKNGGRLFRRPELTLSCRAERKEGRKEFSDFVSCVPPVSFSNIQSPIVSKTLPVFLKYV